MATFEIIQNQLQEIRSRSKAEKKSIFHKKERLKKLELQRKNMLRHNTANSNKYQEIADQIDSTKKTIAVNERQFDETVRENAAILEEFLPFTDPRENMDKLRDNYPVLLFPVRLETRFKIIDRENENPQHQLWVRIFPDKCSIDTFDDTLSESELKRIENYWISIWEAGTVATGNESIKSFVKDKHIGAWRKLMGVINAGRSYWLTQHYKPENEDQIPIRNKKSDVILVIPTEIVPDAPIQNALRQYWQSVLLAQGNATTTKQALQDLMNTLSLSEEVAVALTKQYQPRNIDTKQLEGEDSVEIIVVFLQFPKSEDVHTKLDAWSQATTVNSFPERFVLLGFNEGDEGPEEIINELGESIPHPVIVGPDTRDDITALLKQVHGEEFEEFSDDEKAVKYIEYLSGQAETKWLFNFEEAVNMGLGFKVNLSEDQYANGFDRLFVLGVKIADDAQKGQATLENLIHNHHYGDNGFSILPQGTPTNNTEEEKAGYSRVENAEESYHRYFSLETSGSNNGEKKPDGKWLAEFLGIEVEASSLKLTENYFQHDQAEATAMNTALWNAIIGYFMESMITPVSSDWEREVTRWFLINHVSGRGNIPAIRIGNQPYGILSTGTLSNMQWLDDPDSVISEIHSDRLPVLQTINEVIQKVRKDWKELLDQVAYVGKEGDAHKILLQALGLHASSVEFDRRIAESAAQVYNKYNLEGIPDYVKESCIKHIEDSYRKEGLNLLEHLGYDHDEKENPDIPILEKLFLSKEQDVNRPLIDDNPLSETDPIRAFTETGQNYIQWLIENAQKDHRNIKNQDGFMDDNPPDALLYKMLRHALNLEFANTGLNILQNAQILTSFDSDALRIDANFIDIEPQNTQLQSKWDVTYRKEANVADNKFIVDYISEQLKIHNITPDSKHLHELMAALEQLSNVPTARLERCFVEHLDCCSYRLDAWLLGFLHLQLHAMRFGEELDRIPSSATGSNEEQAQKGIYLGAYGLVENLRPENKTLSPYEPDPELKKIFDPENNNDIKKDDTNAGYIHAPSINQALTSAVLRNAYISNASEEEKKVFNVNLSSERVRMALAIISGMQQGQSLGALLGYQLERGLHDHTDEELDIYIYELRRAFPLVANRTDKTTVEEDNEDFEGDEAITKIEARNVVDGLSLLKHIEKTGVETYPFGFPLDADKEELKAASGSIADAINKEVNRIMNIRDAVADLAMAESVHQVVQGNYERAAGALDAYSKGDYPQLPDVIQSPTSGVTLTQRFGIHLPSVSAPSSNENPRYIAEPSINAWLMEILPPIADIQCVISYHIPDYDEDETTIPTTEERTISMAQLGLEPIDLLYMINVESEKNLTSLDAHLIQYIHQNIHPRPDAIIEINYTQPIEGKITFFEIASIISDLRTLIVRSRPLQSTDISLQNEARKQQNATSRINPARILDIRNLVNQTLDNLNNEFIAILESWIDLENPENTMAHKDDILSQFDGLFSDFIKNCDQLGKFGIPEAGFGFVYDRKKEIYSGVYKKVLDYKKRWDKKISKYEDLIDNLFPAASSDEKKIGILQKAERLISTQYILEYTSVNDLKNKVENKKTPFDTKYNEFVSFLNAVHLNLLDLFNAVEVLKINLNLFDLIPLEIHENEKQIIILAEDMFKQAVSLHDSMSKKVTELETLITKANETTDADKKVQILTEAVQLIFGEDFVILPEFSLGADQGIELQKCLDDQTQLLDFQKDDQKNDFPVDNWLYGIARVREKLAAWESLAITTEGINNKSLEIVPLQLPYIPEDSWLGLSYPTDLTIDSDKLLYTAYLPAFDPTKTQRGLLVDEWTEVIPAKKTTTGMTFHYDRPNCEPPQTMLLAAPSRFTGEWQWDDLVNSLHETLDMARLRAIEPDQINQTEYAHFLPALISAMTYHPVTIALDYLSLAKINFHINSEEDG